MYSIVTGKITGTPGASGWTQIHEFKPQDEEKLVSRGVLVAVVTTSNGTEGVNTVIQGREILSRLHEEYYGKEEVSPFTAIGEAVKKVVDEFSPTIPGLEISAVVIVRDCAYSVVVGKSEVSIFRDGVLAKILAGEGSANVTTASGYPKTNDVLILSSKSFGETVGQGVLKAALEIGGLDSAVEYLAPKVHGQTDSAMMGAAFVKFESKGVAPILNGSESDIEIYKRSGLDGIVSNVLKTLNSLKSAVIKVIPERKIFVPTVPPEFSQVQPQSRKTTLSVGVILLALLIVSIIFGIRGKMESDRKGSFKETFESSRHKLDESISLKGLNAERSRELFLEAKTSIEGLVSKGIKDPEVVNLMEKIKDNEGQILGEYKLEPQQFLDLGLLSSNFSGEVMAASGNNLFVLNKTSRKIASVRIDSKRSEILTGAGDLKDASDLAVYEDNVYVLGAGGIYSVNSEAKNVITEDWVGRVLIYSFAGNFYLLDTNLNKIFRYQGDGKDFGSKVDWFGAGVEPDLGNAISWSIDGSVWVLLGTGRVLKFTVGKQDPFVVSGVYPDITAPTDIYTGDELKYLYILEKSTGRVIVLNKSGEFVATYSSDKIKESTQIAVSERDKKIILLSGSKLNSIEIKHL